MALEISLTDFVDFAISAGTPKLTKVREVRDRGKYEPAHDFWKRLRDEIVRYHRENGTNKNDLDKVLGALSDKKKLGRYPACVQGYKRFLGRKQVEWFEPPAGPWGPEGVSIRVRPELGLVIDGVPHLVKLHLKAEKLTKRRVDIILLLLSETLRDSVPPGTQFAILDVPEGRLFATAKADPTLLPLLIGEAVGFQAMWNSMN